MAKRPLQPGVVESFAIAEAVGSPTSYDAKTRTIPFRWLSQQDHIRVDVWGEKYILRLHAEGCNLSRVNAGGPFKFLHPVTGQASIIGNVVENSMSLSAEFDGQGAARLIEFADDESDTLDDRRAAMKLAKGYMRPVSMDAILEKTSIEEFPDDPGALPIVHALEWSVAAVSSVPLSQDPGALTMEAQMAVQHEPVAPVVPPVTTDPAAAPATAAEIEQALFARTDETREIALVFGLDAVAEKAIVRSKEPLEAVRKRLIAEKAAAGDALQMSGHVRVTVDARDTLNDCIIEGFEARFGNKAPSSKGARFYRRSLLDISRAYLASAHPDVNLDAMADRDITQRALGFGVGGSLAPSDLPVLLTQGVQRVLNRLSVEAGPMPFEALCKPVLVNDLREITIATRTFSGAFQEIGVNGAVEFPFQVGEEYETAKVKQWGGGIQRGRAAELNDDLGALDDLASDILLAAREHQIDRFWSQFLTGKLRDTKLVIHTDHKNLVASGGAGPGTLAQLSKMRLLLKAALFGEKKLRLRMTHLIVPEGLYDEASQIVSGVIQPTESAKTVPSDYRGLSIISDQALDDNSATLWYAAAAAFPCFAWIRLRGAETPVIVQERVFETRGLKIAGFMDYNIVPIGYQGVVRNKGAA